MGGPGSGRIAGGQKTTTTKAKTGGGRNYNLSKFQRPQPAQPAQPAQTNVADSKKGSTSVFKRITQAVTGTPEQQEIKKLISQIFTLRDIFYEIINKISYMGLNEDIKKLKSENKKLQLKHPSIPDFDIQGIYSKAFSESGLDINILNAMNTKTYLSKTYGTLKDSDKISKYTELVNKLKSVDKNASKMVVKAYQNNLHLANKLEEQYNKTKIGHNLTVGNLRKVTKKANQARLNALRDLEKRAVGGKKSTKSKKPTNKYTKKPTNKSTK